MKKENSTPQSDLAKIRKEAERRIQAEREELLALSEEETAHLVHELRVHQIELEMQNEQLRKTEMDLEIRNNEYRELYDLAPVSYFTLSEKGLILKANLTFARLCGIERKALLNKPLSKFVADDDQDRYYLLINGLLDNQESQTAELKLKKNDGSEYDAQLESIVIENPDNNSRQIRTTLIDVTERKQAEDKIKASLHEKETLLQEIHHRVKNNLAVVSGLLKLQSYSQTDEQLKKVLLDCQNRIQAMAAIHENLYQSEDISSIKMQTYLSKLVSNVVQNYSINKDIHYKIEAENLTIGFKEATTLGLIINELISNSFKYAFPENRKGTIKIILRKNEKGDVELNYSDDGIGVPADFDWYHTDSLGLKLVKMLAEDQLNGSINLLSDQRSCFEIRFRLKEDLGKRSDNVK